MIGFRWRMLAALMVLGPGVGAVSQASASPIGFEFAGHVSQAGAGSVFRGLRGRELRGQIMYDPSALISESVLSVIAKRYDFDARSAAFSVRVRRNGSKTVDFAAGDVDASSPDFSITTVNLGGSGADLLTYTGFNATSFRDLNGQPAFTQTELVFGGAGSFDSDALPVTVPDFARFSSIQLVVHAVDALTGNLSPLFSSDDLVFTPLEIAETPAATIREPIALGLFGVGLLGLALCRKLVARSASIQEFERHPAPVPLPI